MNKNIRDNLHFLIVEVHAQLQLLESCLQHESSDLAQRLIDRSGYTANLTLRIQNACTHDMTKTDRNKEPGDTLALRSLASIAAYLDRIADRARNCVGQVGQLRKGHRLKLSNHFESLGLIREQLEHIEPALHNNDTQLALQLGRAEDKLDKTFRKQQRTYTNRMKTSKHPEDLVNALFIAHSIEQMGDALMHISEEIITSTIGTPLDTRRFQSVQKTVNAWIDDEVSDLSIRHVAETRSGSGIAAVHVTDGNKDGHLAIYKDGQKRKLKEELDGVERWHAIHPGVAPRILRYRKSGDQAALLIEHLDGLTFEQIALHGPVGMLSKSMTALRQTLHRVWGNTQKKKIVLPQFMAQTKKRLHEVYTIHPSFDDGSKNICGTTIPSIQDLLDSAEKIEERFPPAFSVFIHGDFNIDNVLFDHSHKRIRFIDLHRSTFMDYVQDVSVFMVSHYRLQVLDQPIRGRISKQAERMYAIGRSFANKRKDTSFEIRLALGLARSFITSTRFIRDEKQSRAMFLRARYCLESLSQIDSKRPEKFRLPIKELFHGH